MKSNKENCCICGKPFSCRFDKKPYCNTHYLRMYAHGTPDLIGRKTGNPYKLNGNVAELETHDGRTFRIDKQDLGEVLCHKWCFSKTGYLVANINKKTTKLTRYLLNPPPNMVVDHINGDTSDNRRCNLRICSNTENVRNSRKPITSKQKYIGVRQTPSGRFKARIMVDRKEINLGTYDTAEAAYEARLAGEREYFGAFSRHNHGGEMVLRQTESRDRVGE